MTACDRTSGVVDFKRTFLFARFYIIGSKYCIFGNALESLSVCQKFYSLFIVNELIVIMI